MKAQIAKLSEYDTDREAHESEKSNLRTELQHARQQLAKAELQLNRGSELAKEVQYQGKRKQVNCCLLLLSSFRLRICVRM